jgi:hypothetical protein
MSKAGGAQTQVFGHWPFVKTSDPGNATITPA